MQTIHPKASKLWEYINRNFLNDAKLKDFNNFKSSSVNHKLSIWNPETNGVRFLKALIFNICTTLLPQEWEKLSRIKNREVGNPYSIHYNNECVCLDYLQAVFEMNFMDKLVSFENAEIIEIGAGYGRTCHALLSNYEISSYSIVDLNNSLELSKQYLKAVLDESNYDKISFIDVDSFQSKSDKNFTICINIDSFAEMDEKTVHLYLDFINKQCENFYVKNPVGKYSDKTLSTGNEGTKVVNMAMETGILRDIVNIHDNIEVQGQSKKYKKAYRPSDDWECLKDGWARPWSYYWQAFYQKK